MSSAFLCCSKVSCSDWDATDLLSATMRLSQSLSSDEIEGRTQKETLPTGHSISEDCRRTESLRVSEPAHTPQAIYYTIEGNALTEDYHQYFRHTACQD
jgi:hypothetical protein